MKAEKKTMKGPLPFFDQVEDPRIERRKLHQLLHIIVIALMAVICGAETWNEIEYFGICFEKWLTKAFDLKNGIPSHDTFNRVFSRLNPVELEKCFIRWMEAVVECNLSASVRDSTLG